MDRSVLTGAMFSGSHLRAVLLALAGIQLSGCAGVQLYNETRDRQGQAAKKAWSDVDLKSVIAVERTNLQRLLDAEQETQGKVATAYRDNRLREFSKLSKDFRPALSAAIDAQLTALVGSPNAIPEYRAEVDREGAASLANDLEGKVFDVVRLPRPTCAQLYKDSIPSIYAQWLNGVAPTFQKVAVRSTLTQWGTKCIQALERVAPNFAGAYAKANADLTEAQTQLQQQRDASAKERDALTAAVAAHEEAVAASTASPDRAAKILKVAAVLEKAAAALSKLDNVFAIEALSEQRLKSLDEFASMITAAGTDKPVPTSASKEAKAAILLPRLFDEAERALAEAKRPLALPLLLRRTHEELNLEAARRNIAANEAKIGLAKAQMAVIIQQAEALVLAHNELAEVDKAGAACAPELSMAEAFTRCDANRRQMLYSATARYLDAVGRLDTQRYRLASARNAAEHERTLSLSEVSVRQWDSLIGAMVGQVADYNADGVKPKEVITPLINWAAMFYIGAGVNK